MKTFLHVGCGPLSKKNTTPGFASEKWHEIRFDVDPSVSPDIVGSMLEMSEVESGSVNAVYSSHNIEHLFAHEIPKALNEFRRVLTKDGFLVITCPDLQSVAKLIAEDKLTEKAYDSPAGPITPLDMVYGYRPAIEQGNVYMAHKCGFTMRVLVGTLQNCGFKSIAHMNRESPNFDLWALATVEETIESDLLKLAGEHFPRNK